jgi:hypothetical protein
VDTDRAVRKTRRARRALGFERRFDRDARVVDRDATRGSIAFPDETPHETRAHRKNSLRESNGCVSDWERTQLDTSPRVESGDRSFQGANLREALRLSDFVDFD